MALNLRKTISDSLSRIATRNGLVLFTALLVGSAVQTELVTLLTTTYLPLTPAVPANPGVPGPAGSSLPGIVTAPTTLLGVFTGGVLTVPVRLVAVRTFVSNETDRIPEEFVFHRLGIATIHLMGATLAIVGTLLLTLFAALVVAFFASVVFVALTEWTGVPDPIGDPALLTVVVLTLLVPSVFVGASLLFTTHEIAVRDKGILDAIYGSWGLTRGVRVQLTGLALLVVLGSGYSPATAVEALPPALVAPISTICSTLTTFATLVLVARLYRQRLQSAGEDVEGILETGYP